MGFRGQGLEFRGLWVWGSGFRVWNFGLRIGFTFKVQEILQRGGGGVGLMARDLVWLKKLGLHVLHTRFRVQGCGFIACAAYGLGFRP